MTPEELIVEAESFLTAFYSMFKTRHLYPPTHRRFTESLAPVLDSIARLLGANPEAVFLIVEREFIFEGTPLFRTMTGMREFADVFARHGIDRLTIQQGIGSEELISLVNILTMRQNEIAEQGGIEEILRKEGLAHARLERLTLGRNAQEILIGQSQYQQPGMAAAVFAPYALLYRKTESLFDLMYQNRAADIALPLNEALDCLDDLAAHAQEFMDIYHNDGIRLGEWDHAASVCALTCLFAKYLNLEENLIRLLAGAALLHDAGKLSMPAEIRNKPSFLLEPDARKLYDEHPLRGAERLLSLLNAPPLAAIVCYEHHAGYDKKGFPALPAEAAPLDASLLIGLVSEYDNRAREFGEGKKPSEILPDLLPERGKSLHPSLFDLFSLFLGEAA